MRKNYLRAENLSLKIGMHQLAGLHADALERHAGAVAKQAEIYEYAMDQTERAEVAEANCAAHEQEIEAWKGRVAEVTRRFEDELADLRARVV